MVGLNQINTVFDPECIQSQSLHSYDRIAHYYFCPREYDSNEDNEDSNDGSDGGDNED